MSKDCKCEHDSCCKPVIDSCQPCVKRVIKWGLIAYLGHWVLHGIAFLISPALGLWLLALM